MIRSPEIIPVLQPLLPPASAVLPYLQRIEHSGQYTNFGPLCIELEQRFRRELASPEGEPWVCSAANATLALEIALLGLQLNDQARVLMPALTFVATASSVIRAGHQPVFADIDPQCWQLTPALAKHYCEQQAIDCVMPVATYGTPLDITAWDAFCQDTGIPVLIDAAGAFGNQVVGRHCHVVYSLHATKTLSSVEGAIIASRDESLIARLRRLSNFGINLSSGQIDQVGTNAKLSEYHAAVGLASLDAWSETSSRRRVAWQQQQALLRERIPALRWQQGSNGHIHSVMPVLLPEFTRNTEVQQELGACNIASRPWYLPLLALQPAFARYPCTDALPVSKKIATQLLGLPFHLALSDDQREYVAQSLTTILATIESRA